MTVICGVEYRRGRLRGRTRALARRRFFVGFSALGLWRQLTKRGCSGLPGGIMISPPDLRNVTGSEGRSVMKSIEQVGAYRQAKAPCAKTPVKTSAKTAAKAGRS